SLLRLIGAPSRRALSYRSIRGPYGPRSHSLAGARSSEPPFRLVVDEVNPLRGIVAQLLEPVRVPLRVSATRARKRLVPADRLVATPHAAGHQPADFARPPRRGHRRRAHVLDAPDLASVALGAHERLAHQNATSLKLSRSGS